MTTSKPLAPGDTIHFLMDGFTFTNHPRHLSSGRVSRRGMAVVVTENLLEANRDRDGVSWLDLVDDSEVQVQRWGQRVFARGPWPEDLDALVPGSPEAEEERARLRTEAWAIPERSERDVALASIESRFGAKRTSTFVPARGYEGLS